MPLEWDAVHPTAQCKCDGRVCKGARMHVGLTCVHMCLYAAARVCQM